MWPSALDLFLIQLSHPQALDPSGVVEGTTVVKVAMGMVHFKEQNLKAEPAQGPPGGWLGDGSIRGTRDCAEASRPAL